MRLATLLAALAALSCAYASVSPEGAVRARAFGQSSIAVEAPDGTSVVVEGGPVSDGVVGGIGGVLRGALSIFGGAAEPPTVNVIVSRPEE